MDTREAIFTKKLEEAIDLDKNDVRNVRGKYRPYSQINADYQEEADGTLTFLGYTVKRTWTDFTAEVNKTADRAIDFGHFYHVRREWMYFNRDSRSFDTITTGDRDFMHNLEAYFKDKEPVYLSPNPDYDPKVIASPKYLIDMEKVAAIGHFDSNLYTYTEFSSYTGDLYRQEQAILKTITNIAADKFKGYQYANNDKAIEKNKDIRGTTRRFTGADSDRSEIDIVTEIELLMVDIFDRIDNESCNDAIKMDLLRFAAGIVAKKRLGIDSPIAHRAVARGTGKLAPKATPTHIADKLIKDMPNYVVDVIGSNVSTEDAEYFDAKDKLLKAIGQSEKDDDSYRPDDEGKVIPRIRTAKKRGDGYSVFKNMSKKYKSEHQSEIDDEDW